MPRGTTQALVTARLAGPGGLLSALRARYLTPHELPKTISVVLLNAIMADCARSLAPSVPDGFWWTWWPGFPKHRNPGDLGKALQAARAGKGRGTSGQWGRGGRGPIGGTPMGGQVCRQHGTTHKKRRGGQEHRRKLHRTTQPRRCRVPESLRTPSRRIWPSATHPTLRSTRHDGAMRMVSS